MKYLITFIISAIAIFVTIRAKFVGVARGPAPSPFRQDDWHPWEGKKPFNAEIIAKEATKLYYKCGYKSFKFKFEHVDATAKRKIDRSWRYRVKYSAKRCKASEVTKPCKKDKKGKKSKKCKKEKEIKLTECKSRCDKFQAIFKDDIKRGNLRLNVTRLDNGNSCSLIIKYRRH
uniref:Cystatin domain-containing protein n=1 Tax=Strongyloides papillosus TaxID=174720 RepID=A0A0N5BQM7_STREA